MIRPMIDTDIDAVMDIWLKTNISAHNFIPEKYWVGNYHAIMGEYLPKSENFVYETDNQVTAFISVVDGNFIGALFVSGDAQGQGIGGKLVDYCKELYPRLKLAAYKDNTSAIKFYRTHDFKIVKEQHNEGSGHVECIMLWEK